MGGSGDRVGEVRCRGKEAGLGSRGKGKGLLGSEGGGSGSLVEGGGGGGKGLGVCGDGVRIEAAGDG